MMLDKTHLCLWILASALVWSVPVSGDATDTYLVRGTYHWLNQGNTDAAARNFLNALVIDPQNADAAYFLGRIYYQQGLESTVPDEWISLAKGYLNLAEANGIVYDAFRINIRPRLQEVFAGIPVAELPIHQSTQVKFVTHDQRPLDDLLLRNSGSAIPLKQGEFSELGAGKAYVVEPKPKSRFFKWLIAVPIAAAVTGIWLSQ